MNPDMELTEIPQAAARVIPESRSSGEAYAFGHKHARLFVPSRRACYDEAEHSS